MKANYELDWSSEEKDVNLSHLYERLSTDVLFNEQKEIDFTDGTVVGEEYVTNDQATAISENCDESIICSLFYDPDWRYSLNYEGSCDALDQDQPCFGTLACICDNGFYQIAEAMPSQLNLENFYEHHFYSAALEEALSELFVTEEESQPETENEDSKHDSEKDKIT